MVIKILS